MELWRNIRAFANDEDVQKWWHSLPWYSHMLQKSIKSEKINSYDESRSEKKRVKIIQLSNGPYGETAVADWVTHTEEVGSASVGITARQQVGTSATE